MDQELNISHERINQLEQLFTDNYSKLYSVVFRMTGNHHDTEDVLQNSFIKVYQNLNKFQGNAKLSTWIYRIVMNECYRFFDYSKKLPLIRITTQLGISEDVFFQSIDYVPNLEDNLIIEEMREKCLQGFLRCLPKKQRVCILLKNFLNLKNQDIAEVLDVSVDNVKVLLHRGRKKLQEFFEMRCSLIDPQKPCKCHLWIKFMNDHNLPLPEGYGQIKNEELKQEYFKNLSVLNKIDYLYKVDERLTKEQFIDKLKKVSLIL
jgi:RNA polymerase sigma factor, sigma-70 family